MPAAPSDAFGPDEGLFETMRADDGRVPWLERHLDRLEASASILGLRGIASRGEIREAVRAGLRRRGTGTWRVRAVATEDGLVAVDVEPIGAPPPPTALTLPGAWDPSAAIREHKTTRYGALRDAAARARARGAGHALLLDRAGRLGEAATASVLVLVDGRVRTPPIEGLLAGVARAIVIERMRVDVAHLREDLWRRADEIVLVNALRGAMPVLAVDGVAVGSGRPGRLAAAVAATLAGD